MYGLNMNLPAEWVNEVALPLPSLGRLPSVIPDYVSAMEPDESINIEGPAMDVVKPWLIVGGVSVLTFTLSMIGVTAIHRAQDRSWYCSLLPSSFWSSLIASVAAGGTVGILAATGKLFPEEMA
jgi:hypothetical protein